MTFRVKKLSSVEFEYAPLPKFEDEIFYEIWYVSFLKNIISFTKKQNEDG